LEQFGTRVIFAFFEAGSQLTDLDAGGQEMGLARACRMAAGVDWL
jgi:hypothetical protein